MSKLKNTIKNKYGLSNYQIAQLHFVLKSSLSEISKIFIIGVIFHDHLKIYLFLLFIMSILRTFSGGIHFYTYAGCLVTSIVYIWIIISLLSHIVIPLYVRMFLLLLCIMICYRIAPVLSKYRANFPKKQLYFSRNITCISIFIYTIIIYIIPENHYFVSGFWMIILHSLQLFIAKIQKKGD